VSPKSRKKGSSCLGELGNIGDQIGFVGWRIFGGIKKKRIDLQRPEKGNF